MPSQLLTLLFIVLTVTAYFISRYIFLKTKSALLNPVLLSTTAIIIILLFSGITFKQYTPAKDIMTFLLGPATVALAIPLYRNRVVLLKALGPILLGVISGSVFTIITAIMITKLGHLQNTIIASIGPKSVTAPIAIEVSKIVGGDPALTAAFVVATGTLGSVIGPGFLSLCRIINPVARGLAMGTTSHGQGTAVILQEGETQGAMSGVAMALAAILTSFIAPFLIPWLIKF